MVVEIVSNRVDRDDLMDRYHHLLLLLHECSFEDHRMVESLLSKDSSTVPSLHVVVVVASYLSLSYLKNPIIQLHRRVRRPDVWLSHTESDRLLMLEQVESVSNRVDHRTHATRMNRPPSEDVVVDIVHLRLYRRGSR